MENQLINLDSNSQQSPVKNVFLIGGDTNKSLTPSEEVKPVLQRGHSGSVQSIRLSTDGKYLYSASSDKTLKKWDFKSGRVIISIDAHEQGVECLDISIDNTLVATGGMDEQIKIWDEEGKLISVLKGHKSRVSCVAISPDKKLLVSGSWDQKLILWSLEEERIIKILEQSSGNIQDVLFSPDGLKVIRSSWDHTVKIWNLDGSLYATNTFQDMYWSMCMCPKGRYILGGDNYNRVNIWDIHSNAVRTFEAYQGRYSGDHGRVSGVAFNSDGTIFATAGDEKIKDSIRIWDLATLRLIKSFDSKNNHTQNIRNLIFTPNDELLISGSWDGKIKVWEVKSLNKEPITLQGFSEHIKNVVISSDGKYFAFSIGNLISVFDFNFKLIRSFSEKEKFAICAFSPDSKRIAAGLYNKTVNLYDLDNGYLYTFHGHSDNVEYLSFSPDGNFLLTASGKYKEYGELFLWSLGNPGRYLPIGAYDSTVSYCAFSPDGNFIIARTSGSAVTSVFNKRGELLNRFICNSGFYHNIAISLDSKNIVIGTESHSIKVCSFDGELLHEFASEHSGDIRTLAISPDTTLIATGSNDKSITVRNKNGDLICQLNGHEGPINSLVFTSNNRYLLSAAYDDNTIKVWDLFNRTNFTIEISDKYAKELKISPKSDFFAFATYGGSVICVSLFDGAVIFNEFFDSEGVSELIISSNGDFIIAGSYNNDIKIWNLRGGLIKTLKGHTSSIYGLAVSPDDHFLVSAGHEGAVFLWELKSDLIGPVNKFTGLYPAFSLISFSDDGKYIAAKSADCIYIWDIFGNLVRELKDTNGFDSIDFSKNWSFFAYSSKSYVLNQYDMNGQKNFFYKGYKSHVQAAVFSPDNQYIISGGSDYAVYKHKIGEAEPVQVLYAHKHAVIGLLVTSDNKLIISADEFEIKFWNFETGQLICSLAMTDEESYAIYTPDNLYYISNPDSLQFYKKEQGYYERSEAFLTSEEELNRKRIRFIDLYEIISRLKNDRQTKNAV